MTPPLVAPGLPASLVQWAARFAAFLRCPRSSASARDQGTRGGSGVVSETANRSNLSVFLSVSQRPTSSYCIELPNVLGRMWLFPPQPASAVSGGYVPFARICATFPRLIETVASLCSAFFSFSGGVRGISCASLRTRVFNIRVLISETRFEFA
jgi:hypothetical protein